MTTNCLRDLKSTKKLKSRERINDKTCDLVVYLNFNIQCNGCYKFCFSQQSHSTSFSRKI